MSPFEHISLPFFSFYELCFQMFFVALECPGLFLAVGMKNTEMRTRLGLCESRFLFHEGQWTGSQGMRWGQTSGKAQKRGLLLGTPYLEPTSICCSWTRRSPSAVRAECKGEYTAGGRGRMLFPGGPALLSLDLLKRASRVGLASPSQAWECISYPFEGSAQST